MSPGWGAISCEPKIQIPYSTRDDCFNSQFRTMPKRLERKSKIHGGSIVWASEHQPQHWRAINMERAGFQHQIANVSISRLSQQMQNFFKNSAVTFCVAAGSMKVGIWIDIKNSQWLM